MVPFRGRRTPPDDSCSSMISRGVFIAWAILICQVHFCYGHARLMDPPSRASMWRVGFDNPADFSDNEGFCGGFRHQHGSMEGKCGICGDPWDGPRDHEAPDGVFANGLITRTYQPGDDINVEVDVTANHKGHFVFKLCANNNLFSDPNQDCFDETVLEVLPHMEPQFNVTTDNTGTYALKLRLPANVTCKQCILQWTYTCGNNWGVCPDGTGALGCGPQEMFRACSDIAIEGTPVDNDNSISDEKEVSTSSPYKTTPRPLKWVGVKLPKSELLASKKRPRKRKRKNRKNRKRKKKNRSKKRKHRRKKGRRGRGRRRKSKSQHHPRRRKHG
ncbi:hypothetical protein TCAL_02381 [Tigriopus californicus]|uniref:Chitin-binding type-4 domain-containing protein n=2 Tax=Tigriopus californicus TaxID=6832 RepID=A0A553NYD8_TIGCA|nr:hypothetical protein TCAL_02381 [Tigriopus californicus]